MRISCFLVSVLASIGATFAAPDRSPLAPDAIVDLRTPGGVGMVNGQWRYTDAVITEVDHRVAGADNKPSGLAVRTHDVSPHAGSVEFDDAGWEEVDPTGLERRRSTGRLAFGWYRLNITIPERVGTLNTAGASVYFEIVVDDYAEVWVDGRLPQVLGQSGGALVRGWNSPNRVLLTDHAKPGQRIQVAVFCANGPLSEPPANYIWIRSATLDFYRPGRAVGAVPVSTEVTRVDPAIDVIILPGTQAERLADGFSFVEGPVWASVESGYLLFSDPNRNVIHRWSPDGEVSIYRTKSGYTGTDIGEYHQPGSNGLAIDPEGRLTICEHGNRRVTRLEHNGTLTVLADRHNGKRLNSPNDLVYRSDGTLYFTDPPFGLPRAFADPSKELEFSGVYCLYNGTLRLVGTDMTGPNGLALSPDEKHLYVDNWDEKRKVVMRYDVAPDGSLSNGAVFFDMTGAPGEEALDGLKVDAHGNVYVSGPGGVWIISAAGAHLGTLVLPELPANFAWGDADGRTLYMTARTGLYRILLGVPGSRR
ncbi:MAG: SMP-30/gluconolactonase/LRE family protein [Phycisphaeraceae bacterium]|nr:SMP-30/gluconolactonase/LRE family protein [Phycisphaeraceae bacterium]